MADKFLNISLEYMGAIPEDSNINKAVMKQQPLSIAFPKSQASRAIEDIAKLIIDPQAETGAKTKRRGLAGIFSETLRRTLNR